MVGEGQLVFLLFKCLRVEEQCLSRAHRVLAYLPHVSIREDILLDVKDGDSLVHRLLQVLHSSPAHRRFIHALGFRWQVHGAFVRVLARLVVCAALTLEEVVQDRLLHTACDRYIIRWTRRF